MRLLTLRPRRPCTWSRVLEEMPVQETVDGIADLRAHGLPVGGVVVNLVRPRDLDGKALGRAQGQGRPRGRRAPTSSGPASTPDDALVDALLAEARDHAERRALEDAQRKVVAGLDVPTYELPRLAGGIDLGALYELAGLLRDQGMA